MNEAQLDRKVRDKILKGIQHGHIATLSEVKAKNPSFHWASICYEKTGDTALHIAAKSSHLTTIDYLLREFNPCSVNIKNHDDKTPLHEAAQFARLDSVLKLCSNGADVNALRRGDWTPLMLACTKTEPKISSFIVRELVGRGANVNVKNKDGWTCVHILAREGEEDIFDYLVDNGLQVCVTTSNKRTALHIACLHGHKSLIAKLLAYIDINTKDSCGNAPIHEAIMGKNIEIARLLVQQGADIHLTNNSDLSLLHLAATQETPEVLEYVLNELNFDINCQNKLGWTPAHCAARKNLKNIVEYLEKRGADLSIKDTFHRTVYDYLK